MVMRMKKSSFADIVFDVISYGFMTIFALACIFPFFYVLAYSVTPYADYLQNPQRIIPAHIDLGAYKKLLGFPLIYSGYKVTIFITAVGTLLNIFLLTISAYPLSKKDLKGRNQFLAFITFTMFFNGGLIPNFYLVRSLGMYNTVWSLIIPGVLGAYNLILMKNFIATIPESLEESAIIDGANEITVLFRIIVPLSKPAIATFVIFHAVSQWNTFFSAIIYTSKRSLWPLMLILREMVVEDGAALVNGNAGSAPDQNITIFTLKMAVIIFATLPILLVYPFLQKHFMKGVLLGSIKG